MDKIKYTKAPVSEVILGITFNENLLKKENCHLKLIAEFSSDFPLIENFPPMIDEVFSDGKILRELNAEKSGEILYRLRTINKDWLLQIQLNKFYLNWIRQDNEEVGKYPGFTEILKKYNELISKINANIELRNEDIYYLELTYQDRLDYKKENISNVSDINNFINLSIPNFKSIGIENEMTGISNKYTFPLNKLNGHLSISISNGFSAIDEEKKIFSIQFSTKGKLKDIDLPKWFNDANEIQYNLFRSTFKEGVLNSWL